MVSTRRPVIASLRPWPGSISYRAYLEPLGRGNETRSLEWCLTSIRAQTDAPLYLAYNRSSDEHGLADLLPRLPARPLRIESELNILTLATIVEHIGCDECVVAELEVAFAPQELLRQLESFHEGGGYSASRPSRTRLQGDEYGSGTPKVALILTDDERVRLDSLAHRARTAPYLARRARIILACAEGHDNELVAKRLRMSQPTVCKWRARFVRERLDGLHDEPRPGAPRHVTRRADRARDCPDVGRDAAWGDALEQSRHGESQWARPHDGPADLACVRPATASE